MAGWEGRTNSNEFVPRVGQWAGWSTVETHRHSDGLHGLDGDSNRLGLGLVSVSGAML